MTGRNMIETVMGAVVLAVAGIFLAFAYNHSSLRTVSGYEVSARFDRVDGVSAGTDVRIVVWERMKASWQTSAGSSTRGSSAIRKALRTVSKTSWPSAQ